MNNDEGQVIQEDVSEPSHYAMIPKMAMIELDPYELSLYCHYKMTASENGKCWKSNQTLANETGMSVSKIKGVRSELAKKGFIGLTENKGKEGFVNAPPTVTIINLWTENRKRFAKKEVDTPSHQKATPQFSGDYPQPPKSHKESVFKNSSGRKKTAPQAATSQSPVQSNAAPNTTPLKESPRLETKKRSEKSPKTRDGWLKRLPPAREVVVAMLGECYDGWDAVMMKPEDSLTVSQLEKYITNAEEYQRLGGRAEDVKAVYEFVSDQVDYTVAPKTIADWLLRWKASQQADKEIERAYEVAKSHVETLMTNEQRKQRLEEMRAAKAEIFG